MELEAFLASQLWLRPLRVSSMAQLKSHFSLFVVLKDSICSFHTMPHMRSSSSGSSGGGSGGSSGGGSGGGGRVREGVSEEVTCSLDGKKSFALEIIIGVDKKMENSTTLTTPSLATAPSSNPTTPSATPSATATATATYPSSLFFRINKHFYLVNHTIIDELSFPKVPSPDAQMKLNQSTTTKMPVASMKIGYIQMRITFSTCNNKAGDAESNRSVRIDAIHRLANVATVMNETLKFSLLVDHPVVVADTSYDDYIMMEDNEGSYGNNSSTTIGETDPTCTSSSEEFSLNPMRHSSQPGVDAVTTTNDKMNTTTNIHDYDNDDHKNKNKKRKRMTGGESMASQNKSQLCEEVIGDVARDLLNWADVLEEVDYLLQPKMTSEQITSCLLSTSHDSARDDNPLFSAPCVLESSANQGIDNSEGPNLCVLLQLLAQSRTSTHIRKKQLQIISEEMSRIENEAVKMLDDIFDGNCFNHTDGDNNKGGNDETSSNQDDKIEERDDGRRNGGVVRKSNVSESHEVNAIQQTNDDNDAHFAAKENSLNDSFNLLSQGTDDGSLSPPKPLPLPLSQFSFQEKMEFYGSIDNIIDKELSKYSEAYASVLAVLPSTDDFSSTT